MFSTSSWITQWRLIVYCSWVPLATYQCIIGFFYSRIVEQENNMNALCIGHTDWFWSSQTVKFQATWAMYLHVVNHHVLYQARKPCFHGYRLPPIIFVQLYSFDSNVTDDVPCNICMCDNIKRKFKWKFHVSYVHSINRRLLPEIDIGCVPSMCMHVALIIIIHVINVKTCLCAYVDTPF